MRIVDRAAGLVTSERLLSRSVQSECVARDAGWTYIRPRGSHQACGFFMRALGTFASGQGSPISDRQGIG